MENSITSKKNISSLQVLKTLQLLMENDFSMSELVDNLNKKEKDAVFNNSVVSKYICTCRFCGIDIPKIRNNYYVAHIPFGLNLSKEDLEVFESLQHFAKCTLGQKAFKMFTDILNRIERYSNRHISRVENKAIQSARDTFYTAINDQRKIQLMYRDKTVLECIPLAIVDDKKKMYFHVIAKGKEKLIVSNRIVGVKALDTRYNNNYSEKTVIYRLTGDLAKRYSLKENEQIINKTDNYLVISNKGENKELLLARLMRYDICCEITNPSFLREEMIERINSTLNNYGE